MAEQTIKTAILATGGIDSTLLLYQFAKRNPIVLSINYGQSVWQKQKELILLHMRRCNITTPFVEIPVTFADWQKTPGLFELGYRPERTDDLKQWNELPHAAYFVEGRNAIMFGYALAYCSAHKIDELLLGFEYEAYEWQNQRTYRLISDDTSPRFLDTMNILALFGFSHTVRLRAPFYEQRMDKKAIIRECQRLGIDLNETYSCYFWPGPCGRCDNCRLKAEALQTQ